MKPGDRRRVFDLLPNRQIHTFRQAAMAERTLRVHDFHEVEGQLYAVVTLGPKEPLKVWKVWKHQFAQLRELVKKLGAELPITVRALLEPAKGLPLPAVKFKTRKRDRMGTHALTIVESRGKPLLALSRQSDGYPSAHGVDLVKWCDNRPVVNGIGRDRHVFNGMGCLAANLVGRFKQRAGGFYIVPLPEPDQESWGYRYTLYVEDEDSLYGYRSGSKPSLPVMIRFQYGDEVLWEGPLNKWPIEEWSGYNRLDAKGLQEVHIDLLRKYATHAVKVPNANHIRGGKPKLIEAIIQKRDW